MGGNAPKMGFHSVIESPEPVSLVIPPNKTCTMIIPTPANNQMATARVPLFCVIHSFIWQRYYSLFFKPIFDEFL
jgi:hypothetical protein